MFTEKLLEQAILKAMKPFIGLTVNKDRMDKMVEEILAIPPPKPMEITFIPDESDFKNGTAVFRIT